MLVIRLVYNAYVELKFNYKDEYKLLWAFYFKQMLIL